MRVCSNHPAFGDKEPRASLAQALEIHDRRFRPRDKFFQRKRRSGIARGICRNLGGVMWITKNATTLKFRLRFYSLGRTPPAVEGTWEIADLSAKGRTRKTANHAPIQRAASAGNPHTDQRWPFLLRHREETRSFPQHNPNCSLLVSARKILARRSPQTPLPARAACRFPPQTTHTGSEAERCSAAALQ